MGGGVSAILSGSGFGPVGPGAQSGSGLLIEGWMRFNAGKPGSGLREMNEWIVR